MKLVLGSRGRLGQALVASFRDDEVIAPDRSLYASWSSGEMGNSIAEFLRSQNIEIVYIAAGLTDARLPAADLEAVNAVLPRNVIAGARRSGCRVVTFGTVMEELVGHAGGNAYVRSKMRLAEIVTQAIESGMPLQHLRIHTLYGGGPPEPFMFLGQLLQAMRNGERFAMSPGDQLREYHHVDDEVKAIAAVVRSGAAGITDLSHGESVKLKDIAVYVLARLDRADMLDLGRLPAPVWDNYERIFPRQKLLADISFRSTLPSIFEYLATWIKS